MLIVVDFQSIYTLRILGMSWGVETTCFEAPGVSLGGSGVSIGGFRILRVRYIRCNTNMNHQENHLAKDWLVERFAPEWKDQKPKKESRK